MAETVSVRDLADGTLAAITAQADAAGMSREAWLREQIETLAQGPIIRKRYSFKAVSENGAYASIKREHDFVQRGARNCSGEQFDAYQRACDYVERNELGDYEAAYKLLVQQFDEVFPK